MDRRVHEARLIKQEAERLGLPRLRHFRGRTVG
jgi:hypothetical protein